MIFRELENEGIEGQDRNLTLTSRFDSFSYWNWNKIPSRSDPLISALDWLDVTQAVLILIRVFNGADFRFRVFMGYMY